MNIDSVKQMSYFADYFEGKNKLYFSSKLPNYSIRNLQCSEINIYKILSLELKYQLLLFPFPPSDAAFISSCFPFGAPLMLWYTLML